MKYKKGETKFYHDIEAQATIDEYAFDDYDVIHNFRTGMSFITVYDEETDTVIGSFIMTGYVTGKGAVYECIYSE